MAQFGPTSILITGASSGIGAALARYYAGPGVALHLGGRSRDRLKAVVANCEQAGAEVAWQAVDVTQTTSVRDWVRFADRARPLDLVVANAGVSAGTGGDGETEDQARQVFDVNLNGVINTVHPAMDLMRPRRRGRIALMSSLAGFRGFPGAPAYSASKAAVLAYGEALRGSLAPDGVGVSVICPGFVKSPMTDVNRFPMPFLVSAEKAAANIAAGIERNDGLISFPWPMRLAVGFLARLPSAWGTRILSKLPEKD